MRLSKIKLAGFKSFVDPTTIYLPSNLVGIIGPNGCGKSNVIDAVRWVMGESSAKTLRGDTMADVIFSGSTGRKPVGTASVELEFDNSDGSIGGQYAGYSEISIRRQVSRDGISAYFLNGTKCRRRDITDIFLGTGLGPRSYSIIEQGMISRLIEAKPDDLRAFFEEAAGISRYKERRRETENRIRHTRENLDRLNDLLDEIGKQIEKLKRQSRAAGKYQELKEEERQVGAELLVLRHARLHDECTHKEHVIKEHEIEMEALLAHQRALESGLEKLRDSLTEKNDAFNTAQGHYYKLGADVARIEQAIQHTRDSRQQQEEELARSEQTLKEIGEHIAADTQRLEEIAREVAALEPQLSAAQVQAEQSGSALKTAEQRMSEWQAGWEAFNQRVAEKAQISQVEQTRIDHLQRHMQQLDERLERMTREQKTLGESSLGNEIEQLLKDFNAQGSETVDLHIKLDAANLRITEIRTGVDGQEHELSNLQDRHHELRGQLASLETLQQAALGQQSGDIKGWLTSNGLGNAKRLAQQIKVEKSWETAVETVLGVYLEAVCVDGLDNIESMLSSLKRGSVALLDTRGMSPPVTGGVHTALSEKITSSMPLGGLLEGVYVTESLSDALAMRSRLTGTESVVTRDGVWMGKYWLRVARDVDEKAGVLEREREISSHQDEIGKQSETISTLRQQIGDGREAFATAEAERDHLQEEYNRIHRLASELQAQINAGKTRLDDQEIRSRDVLQESESLHDEKAGEETEFSAARERLQFALQEIERQTAEREQHTREQHELTLALDDARDRAHTGQQNTHDLAIRAESMRTAGETTRQSLERMREQSVQLVSRRDELSAVLAQGDTPIVELEQELATLVAKRMASENALAEARRQVEDTEHAVRERDQQRVNQESAVSEQREKVTNERMAWQETRVRSDTLLEQIVETGFDHEQLKTEMVEEAAVDTWAEKLETLEKRIARLGPINLAAIEEYEEESRRKVYLDAQNEDLLGALTTLENAIARIDKETRSRFRETFDKVNEGLQRNFPRLFGGGQAYLEMTGEDMLDAGVTIMARPPGKRNSTIHLLSGGEKALTAIAMVFSIFELNPSPFCMLDEVDAPLDDANVSRYCEMVREMSEHVQFIVITHNKITMELTNQLTGITMSEPGVSRLVAVDLDEAVKLAAV